MPKFRKKPIVIEADQWFKNGDLPEECDSPAEGQTIEGSIVRYFRRPDIPGKTVCEHCKKIMQFHGWIDTLEGGHIVCPGDWIITGISKEKYPCKPDIFVKTYEPVDENLS